jgi:hypothetical protein
MAAPVITLYDSANTAVVSSWPVGTVKAGNPSSVLELLVWNNKGGASAVSDLKEATVACKDGNGENTGEVPVGLWMNTLVNSTAALDTDGTTKIYSAIGGDTTRPLRGEGVSAATGDVISGAVNDGTTANSTTNYCNCKFKVVIPINATAGTFAFKLRFQGYYV